MKPKSTPTLSRESFEIRIESLSYFGGRGVGRHEGMVVFVPGTAPGDQVRVRITARKPRFLEAEIVEILQAGPGRRKPPCPVAGRCGGCTWQHVDYSVQIAQKEKILRDSLKKLAPVQNIQWRPFVAAPNEFHYRNRIQLQVRGGEFGFFAQRSRDLVPIDRCWIAEDKINQGLSELSADELGGIAKVELAVQTDGTVVAMPGQRDPEAALFAQVNSAQNERLLELLRQQIAFAPDWILDLYCGSGNLTLPLADQFSQATVTGIELSRAAIDRGRELAPHLEWIAGDVGVVLSKVAPRPGQGLIVVDPPRTGCETSVIGEIRRHAPKQIIYVSCNPSTFARDAERLCADGAYIIESVQGLDMFPQTEHVELISSLRAATLLTS